MTQRRLVSWLVLFFLALAIPSSILVYQAYAQLKWEAFYQHQRLARELTLRIDSGFRDLIEREEKRPISDYEFLNVTGSGETGFLQRSPLSEFPVPAELPGLLGYFQVDASGQLRTPLVPDADAGAYGIGAVELAERQRQEERILGILDRNRLIGKSDTPAPAATWTAPAEDALTEAMPRIEPLQEYTVYAEPVEEQPAAGAERADRDSLGQAAFDELTSRKVEGASKDRAPAASLEDLGLEDSFSVARSVEAEEAAPRLEKQSELKRSRKEKVNLPQTAAEGISSLRSGSDETDDAAFAMQMSEARQRAIRIETFESEVDPMEFALLDSGHFVLFRRVWHNDERYVQGILIEQAAFVERLIEPAFRESALASMSRLIVAYQGEILRRFDADYSRLYQPSARAQTDELLYQGRLIAPFANLELIFTLSRLPIGAGGQVIIWSALVLAIVLVGGCLMLLRLGQRQLALARQQQDFVSAVSHELKTPLTSIRMYGEMLREGWANEEKRKSYYDFIFHEAERLTRLINNVLQLARMSRNEQQASLHATTVSQALDELRPRLESQLEPSGFRLVISNEDGIDTVAFDIDIDWFIQIFINLVDNAVKFAADAEIRKIELTCRRLRDGRLQFSVRDYGPGIKADQMKKIFQLFYRSENELTRETVGTGIGLALVHQLAGAMQAEVDVVNAEPGAEFRIRFRTNA